MSTIESNSRRCTILKEYGVEYRKDFHAASYETIQEVLKIHFKHMILSLTRTEALDDLIYMFNNFDNIFDDVTMLELIGTMMNSYAKSKSIDNSDKEGAKVCNNSNHGIAKTYVAYLSKDGKEYWWDWNNQFGNEINSTKDELYTSYCRNIKAEIEASKKASKKSPIRKY